MVEAGGAPEGAQGGVVVLGLGNVLMGDDALGPTVIARLLASHDFEEGVSVLDAGTPGLDLTPFIANVEALVVVDSVSDEGEPGELRVLRGGELAKTRPGPRLSPHDPGLEQSLLTLDLAGSAPREVCLIGVVVGSVAPGVGLDPRVRAAIPEVEKAVLAELTRLGRPALPRSDPQAPDIWWERP